jgi:hypothetical protein
MPGATPIYGFPYPDPSDLVANYPALGQDLAEDIETVIDGLSAGALSLVTSQSFSAVSSVSVNNCFTSTYQNYKMLFFCTNSAQAQLNFRYRVSGADNTSALYYMRGIVQGGVTSTEANLVTLNEIIQTGVENTSLTMELFNPQATLYPMSAYIAGSLAVGNLGLYRTGTGFYGATTAFDGFTLSLSTGNMTGTLRVYGYQNS